MSKNVSQALTDFIQQYQQVAITHPELSLIEYDPDWPSECYQNHAEQAGAQVKWQPIKRKDKADFSELGAALGMTVHADIVDYYCTFWSDNLVAQNPKGKLQLLQAWNQDDFARLQQNLIGHILMKRRLKQPDTLFFALTDEEDFILTLDNMSGEVLLEQVGRPANQVLACNLATFLQSLQPVAQSD